MSRSRSAARDFEPDACGYSGIAIGCALEAARRAFARAAAYESQTGRRDPLATRLHERARSASACRASVDRLADDGGQDVAHVGMREPAREHRRAVVRQLERSALLDERRHVAAHRRSAARCGRIPASRSALAAVFGEHRLAQPRDADERRSPARRARTPCASDLRHRRVSRSASERQTSAMVLTTKPKQSMSR